MLDFCKNFKGGFCEILKVNTPRSFCHRRCSNMRHPDTATMALTLVGSVVSYASKGFPNRTKEEIEKIKAVCSVCEFYRTKKCVLCGCNLAAKIKMATTKCPAGKWEATWQKQRKIQS